jgi:large subunit ribosomal protein L1
MASKRYKKLPEKTKDLNSESMEKLLPELKKNCTTKFDESLDLSFQINNKQKKSEVNIRTVVNLPGGTGKKVKVAVVCEDNKAQDAKDAGADIVGGDEFVERIKGGELNFEKLIPELKKNCTTKFDESLDLSFQINNKQKKSEVNIRTVVNLPGGTGKKVKVAVVCEDNKAQEAKDAGADIVGSDEFVEKIKGGEINFEKLICTPGMMVKLSKLGKVLGPKGLMPNPKLGSVSDNIKEAVTNAKSGQVEIRNDKDGNIGVSIGKKSFSDDQLMKNYNAILDALEKEKSNNTLKGDLIRSVFATSTMGVSYKVKLGKSI